VNLWRDLAGSGITEAARQFNRDKVAPAGDEIDREDRYPIELVTEAAANGWNSLTLPGRYGGASAPLADLLSVFEEVSVGSAALGISLITIFQCQKIVEHYGSESLKERLLPRFGQGLCTSFALTEPGHGSDIRQLDTKAARTSAGWLINGEKAFITSGSCADVFVILTQAPGGHAVFAVPRELTGVSTRETPQAQTFGLRNGPHINLLLENVEVPDDALIGEEGRGLKYCMTTLSNSRVLAAGISLGIARAAFDGALAYALGRDAFGGKVSDLQGIQWYFAEMATRIDAARLLAYQGAADLQAGYDVQRSSSTAKLLASEVATDTAAKAVQICGAHGTRTGSPFGRYLRDAKTYELAGGSSEVLKNTIAKSLINSAAQDRQEGTP
jgi:alkylation response protein AidB-like acyl-CoA dehydrogenase